MDDVEPRAMAKANVFLTYSHVDEAWKVRVAAFLAGHEIEIWNDADDGPDEDRLRRLEVAMRAADAAVLLVSQSFLDSRMIQEVVIPFLCQRQGTGKLRMLPVLIDACEWQGLAWLDGRTIRSVDGEPLTKGNGSKVEEALTALAEDVASDPAQPLPPFEAVFREHFKPLVYFFGRLGASGDECRDLAQEAFSRAYKARESFRGEASVQTWLQKIARNLWRNRSRNQAAGKRRAIEVSIHSADADNEDMELTDGLGKGGRLNPEDRLLMAESLARLKEALAKLPPQRKRCLYLRIEGHKYREIAAFMGISIQSVRSHLNQAREQLRELLGEDFGDLFPTPKTEKS
jgi:RNA polymerase sigma-70 factor (ECF subfamily)